MSEARKLRLRCNLCPGDVLTLTAAVESLHAQFPGQYQTAVATTCSEIWEHNPHITTFEDDDQVDNVDVHYPSINLSNQQPRQFLAGYTEFLAEYLERPLRLSVNRPHLYLSDDERAWRDQIADQVSSGRRVPFWLVNAGIKDDYTAKLWPVEYYQEVIDATRGRIQWVQIGAREHRHPDLAGVIDLRGKTDHRQLIRLAYHAAGGLGPVTYLQHLMAAWEKPYICLAGGREPLPWIQYPLQTTLHTMGQLHCCEAKACWRSRVEPLGDDSGKDGSLCEWPAFGFERPVARCMSMIKPADVLNVLERFN